ncbi:glycine-rich protein, partial [Pontibacter burrus]
MKKLLLFFFFSCLLFDAVAGPFLNHSSWRWRNDDGSETSATWKGAENEEIKITNTDEAIRLRLKIHTLADVNFSNEHNIFLENRLSYSESVDGPFIKISATSTANEHFVMDAGAYVPSGTPTTQQLTNTGETYMPGQVINSGSPVDYFAFKNQTNVKEFEWVLKPTSSVTEGRYYFKLDGAGNSNLPSLVYEPKSQPIAVYLNGLHFDGVNDYVEIPSQASNQFDSETEFTVSLWFKANSMAAAGLFNRPSGGGGDMQFWLTAENGVFTYGIDKHGYGWTWIATEKAYEVGEWVHVTTVRRNVSGQRRMEIYANGKLVGSGTVNYTSSASGAPIRIGTFMNVDGAFADGQIDNVSLWKKALTVEEIKSLAVTTLNGNEAGLAGFWRFNETSGTIAYDATPNANHGIIKDMGLSTAWSSLNAGEVTTLKDEAYIGFLTARDVSGDPLTYSIVTAPVNGTLTIGNAATGAFTYTPAANLVGTDAFSYKVSNGAEVSNTATVNVTIVEPNKAPVPALAALPTLTGECAVTVTAPTANDDNDGVITGTTTDPLSYKEQGNYTITWTYRDKEGLTSTQTQQVVVKDETKPVFAAVASITKNNDADKCGAVVTYTMPTATDNCVGSGEDNKKTFNFTGSVQTFTVPVTGKYTLETWGAQGGNDLKVPNQFGGRGGYSKGEVTLTAGTTLYIYVGGQGTGSTNSSWASTGGGGATDIRLINGAWNNSDGLYSRIIVAGGGGGRHGENYEGASSGYVGNDGGGLNAPSFSTQGFTITGSGQTNGGTSTEDYNSVVIGSFGFANPNNMGNSGSVGGWNGGAAGSDDWANGGAGGGWYGGVTSWPTSSGGSGYVLTADSFKPADYTPTAEYYMTDAQLIAGNATMPNPEGGEMVGRSGHGIAVISWKNETVTITQTAGLPSGSLFPVGKTTNTFTATDAAGNIATISFDVTVTDTQKPTVVTKNITVNLYANGNATIKAEDVDNGSTDNCSIAADGYSLSQTEFTCADLGTKTVTLTVTDVNGNSETATAVVTIVDPIKPTITAPAAVVVNTDAGKSTASGVVLGTPTIADNCSDVSVTNDAPATFSLGKTTVTWTVTDASGHKATATQVVTVQDKEAPVPTIATLPTITGQCGATVTAVPSAEDNVSGTVAGKTTDLLSYTAQGTYTITWTYTDAAGNSSSQTQQVVVKDDTAPIVKTKAITVQLDATGKATIKAEDVDNGSTDNCGIEKIALDITAFD